MCLVTPWLELQQGIFFAGNQAMTHSLDKGALYRALLAYLLPYASLLTAGLVLYLSLDHAHQRELLKAHEQLQIELARKSLTRDFEQVLPDINVLANTRHLRHYIDNFSETERAALGDEFISFALQKRIYNVIRLLDMEGHERVRVNYTQGKARTVAAAELQDKGDSYYFKDSRTLGRGELYISPIDLNVDYGRIEIPYVPVIRFATPVFDRHGVKRGVLLLHYLAEPMLGHFDEMLAGSRGHVALLNNDGYWIRSHDRQREWGFMFDNDVTFATSHPRVWTDMQQHDSGTVTTDDALFIYTTIHPVALIGGYSAAEVQDDHLGHHHIDPESYAWRIVSDLPLSVLRQHLYDALFGVAGLVWLTLLLGGMGAAWAIAGHRMERRRMAAEIELHAKLYETTTEGVMITDADNNIVAVNDAFTSITGYTCDEALGKTPRLLASGRHDRAFYQGMWSALAGEGHWEGEIYNRRKDGGLYIAWLRISVTRNEQGKVNNYVCIFSDVTRRKLSEEELRKRAHHDPLTGLHNRLSFDERFSQELARARRTQSRLGLLYIDLDAFKPIKDRYGHRTGDAVLREVAARLKSAVREMDTVSRIGGDEFTVILPEIGEAANVDSIADGIHRRLQLPFEYEGRQLQIGASIGVALFPDHASSERELLTHADAAMYRIKQESGDRAAARDKSPVPAGA
jgi:diguanylate cyclase (GGDEF)-like protein/PAS domain S-box-containing protein